MARAPLPRTFWFLFAGALVNRIGSFVVPLFAIYLTGERGYTPTAAGVVLSLYGLGSLLSGPLGGLLADRIGRRATMLIGFCWGACAMLLVPYASTPTAIALASFHLGLSGDLYRPAINAAVADLCPPSLRPRAFGYLYWAVNLGFAVATSLGGMLAHHGFGLLFRLDAATTLSFAVVIAIFVPETRPPHQATTEPDGTYGEALADRAFAFFIATQCIVGLIFIQSQVALPVTLGQRGIGAQTYGLIIAENGVLIVLLQPVALWVVERMRRTHALALGALLMGIGFAWNALPFGVPGAAISVAIWTLGEIVTMPVVPALIGDLAPTRMRGRYQGVGQMSYGLCALLGPTGGMALYQHLGAAALWSACLLLGAIAALLYLASAPALAVRLRGRGAPA